MILDSICQAFNCTPKEALRQNPKIVFGILASRGATQAKEQHNRDASKMSHSQIDFMHELALYYHRDWEGLERFYKAMR